MDSKLKKLNQQIDALALDTIMLDPEDIPGLGKVLTSLDALMELIGDLEEPSLNSILAAMKGYIEKVVLREKSDLSPFEKGVSHLQEICRNLMRGRESGQDFAAILMSLDYEITGPDDISSTKGRDADVQPDQTPPGPDGIDKEDKHEEKQGDKGTASILEDKEIIADFVTESLENLGTIEVKLMDLEQSPSDLKTINDIFRPFHTLKGVAGFLNFMKISRLAHIVESLLDKARNRELTIDGEIVDAVLDSVDLLKKMIENIQATLQAEAPSEGYEDIEPLVTMVEKLIAVDRGEGHRPLGEILVEKGVVSETDVEDALVLKAQQEDKKLGEILVEQKKVKPREALSALRDQKKSGHQAALEVKVDTEKLDSMVDMVGELAIAHSMLRQNELIRTTTDRKLDHLINQLTQITSGLQKTAMSLRMVPIKNTFQRMVRIVRDLGKKAGKEVQLVMSGEETEIDRNMVEEIYEPMVHMMRNAIDHGLESPEQRLAANKQRQGTIHLSACHKGGSIVIEIEDDGRGLDRKKILAKARSSGLIREGERLTGAEIYNLIFHPGLSTAEEISDISGRGVGMDVVKNQIEKLRGTIDVESVSGQGTTFLVRLPLTLAIVNGMIVQVGPERYIIPTLAVQESFRPKKAEYYTVKKQGEMIRVRDSLVPLVRLDRLLAIHGTQASVDMDRPPWERLVVVVENQERRQCLLVDELLGQEEIVIKSLGRGLTNIKGIAGGAIMGDGRVGLILDIAGMLDLVLENE